MSGEGAAALRAGLDTRPRPEPFTLVLFGAQGDLAQRKLAPALYNLLVDGWLPTPFAVVGLTRRPVDLAARWHDAVAQFSRRTPTTAYWSVLAQAVESLAGDLSDADTYRRLATRLAALEQERHLPGNRLFYLATPPALFGPIAAQLAAVGLNRPPLAGTWTRLIVEKPFGHDRASAQELDQALHAGFLEEQLFRIDHYLGKETVQNLLALRFANGIFEPLWNRQYLDHVEITVAESLGVENRGGYYDRAGALRDMVQNHLLQLVALTAMEPPGSFAADAVRNEKVKVLRALRPWTGAAVQQDVVRGQYAAGFIDGAPVPGYREEPAVAPDSKTETFVALKLWIDNWRWAGVPFFLRTGKRLARRVSEIVLTFKQVPHALFPASDTGDLAPNQLIIRIQPDEGIQLRFGVKVPGPALRVRSVAMAFAYGTAFAEGQPEAYERLLLDALTGDSTLFTRSDEVDAAWAWLSPLLQAWDQGTAQPEPYEAGSWGPAAADRLGTIPGWHWHRP